MQDDRQRRGLQGRRALDRQVDRFRGGGLDIVAQAAQRAVGIQACADARETLARPVDVTVKRKSPAEQKIIGASYPRSDIPAKVFAQPVCIHDMQPEGMLFGAVARPPAYAARRLIGDECRVASRPP